MYTRKLPLFPYTPLFRSAGCARTRTPPAGTGAPGRRGERRLPARQRAPTPAPGEATRPPSSKAASRPHCTQPQRGGAAASPAADPPLPPGRAASPHSSRRAAATLPPSEGGGRCRPQGPGGFAGAAGNVASFGVRYDSPAVRRSDQILLNVLTALSLLLFIAAILLWLPSYWMGFVGERYNQGRATFVAVHEGRIVWG